MTASESETHFSERLVPILDFRDENSIEIQWKRIWAVAFSMGIGGILIRGGTVSTWRHVRTILDGLRPRPLLMADFEQGIAGQIPSLRWLPSAFSLGATGDAELALRAGELVGRQAKCIGLDLVLAPVADLSLNLSSRVLGARCFGATPQRVSDMVSAFIRGCSKQGVGTVVKHFPGHGRTSDDSHSVLPEIAVDIETWQRTDMRPFLSAIRAGCRGVMIGHLWMSSVDRSKKCPASESRAVISELLRRRLGFNGLILSDSLDMAAVAPGGLDVAHRMATAGIDLVLGIQELPHHGLQLQSIPPEQAAHDSEDVSALMSKIDAEVDELATVVASRSIAWTTRPLTDLRLRERIVLLHVCTDGARIEWADSFVEALQSGLPGLHVHHGPLSALVDFAGSCVMLALGRFTKGVKTEAVKATMFRMKKKTSMIPVLFGAPWLIDSFDTKPVLVAGDTLDVTQRAAAAILLGDEEPKGTLDICN